MLAQSARREGRVLGCVCARAKHGEREREREKGEMERRLAGMKGQEGWMGGKNAHTLLVSLYTRHRGGESNDLSHTPHTYAPTLRGTHTHTHTKHSSAEKKREEGGEGRGCAKTRMEKSRGVGQQGPTRNAARRPTRRSKRGTRRVSPLTSPLGGGRAARRVWRCPAETASKLEGGGGRGGRAPYQAGWNIHSFLSLSGVGGWGGGGDGGRCARRGWGASHRRVGRRLGASNPPCGARSRSPLPATRPLNLSQKWVGGGGGGQSDCLPSAHHSSASAAQARSRRARRASRSRGEAVPPAG